MPRKPRFFLPDVPTHIVQRGNNREPIFFSDSDYQAYLGWLQEAAQRWGCAIHAYVLMTNHVHLLLTPRDADGVSRLMQYVGRPSTLIKTDPFSLTKMDPPTKPVLARANSVFRLGAGFKDGLRFLQPGAANP